MSQAMSWPWPMNSRCGCHGSGLISSSLPASWSRHIGATAEWVRSQSSFAPKIGSGSRSGGVLRDAVAEGPVLLPHLDQAHDDIRRFNHPASLDGGREACEQRLLHVQCAPLIAGDLNE